jgi:hypothetical protein
MINQTSYDIETTEGPRHLTIAPISRQLTTGDYYATGVYKLSSGIAAMGDITFDEDMNEWTYNGIGQLNYEEVAEVADFIKNYKDPTGADPNLLQ